MTCHLGLGLGQKTPVEQEHNTDALGQISIGVVSVEQCEFDCVLDEVILLACLSMDGIRFVFEEIAPLLVYLRGFNVNQSCPL